MHARTHMVTSTKNHAHMHMRMPTDVIRSNGTTKCVSCLCPCPYTLPYTCPCPYLKPVMQFLIQRDRHRHREQRDRLQLLCRCAESVAASRASHAARLYATHVVRNDLAQLHAHTNAARHVRSDRAGSGRQKGPATGTETQSWRGKALSQVWSDHPALQGAWVCRCVCGWVHAYLATAGQPGDSC